jgi:hypothetical protein
MLPNAIFYRPRGHRFELRATDARGRLIEQDGRVLVVTGG